MSFEMIDTGHMRRAGHQLGGARSGVGNIGTFRLEEGLPLRLGLNTGVRSTLEYAETAPLMDPHGRKKQTIYNHAPWTSKMSTTAAVALCAAVTLWVLVFVLLAVLYWNLSTSMNVLRREFKPYVSESLDHLINVLRNADHGTANAHEMLAGARDFTSTAVPALQHSLNVTTAIVERLEKLAKNPVLQISMQQG